MQDPNAPFATGIVLPVERDAPYPASPSTTMRATLRCYQSLARRSKTTAFVGLGRMGAEMANNLFSKQFAASQETQFVVCDAVPEAAQAFRSQFEQQYPGASITIAESPQE